MLALLLPLAVVSQTAPVAVVRYTSAQEYKLCRTH